MTISEIFPNPTVKQVIFQIRFPNLFYIENKIGDFQIRIMEKFPESALLLRRQVVFADIGPEGKLETIPTELEGEPGKKIWQFKSGKDFQMNVMSNSLDITSQYHKTYDLENGNKFRDIIKFAVDNFLSIVSVPKITRIGLRYIDECPLPSKDNETFRSYYNSVFPIDRFIIDSTEEFYFKAIIQKGEFYMTYIESLKKQKEDYKLILDFDGFATNISPENYLKITDELHKIILNEYKGTIKEPVYQYMRQRKEE
jgi:uncharacterized protein (TIGR04255 family)